jgi:hypothetical protein
MWATSAVVVAAVRRREPADVQFAVLDVDGDVAGRERVIERGYAFVEIAGELLMGNAPGLKRRWV